MYLLLHPKFFPPNPILVYPARRFPDFLSQTRPILCSKRTGKLRYPSEKKQLKSKHKEAIGEVKNKFEGIWRLSNLSVSVKDDPGKDSFDVSDGLLQEIAKVLKFPVASMLPQEAFSVIRKSFDGRKKLKSPKFVYAVDMDANRLISLEPHSWDFISKLEPRVGFIEHKPRERFSGDLISITQGCKNVRKGDLAVETKHGIYYGSGESSERSSIRKPKIAVVGSGPSGLFASLVLAELGADVTLIERGQAVEQRGRDIGALVVRRILELESNFCFGEVVS